MLFSLTERLVHVYFSSPSLAERGNVDVLYISHVFTSFNQNRDDCWTLPTLKPQI
jgi:hypothetical protein